MRQIIYVATTPGRIEWLDNFFASLKACKYDGKYPIFIEAWYYYDWFDFARHHDFDEMLFLHDSVEILDASLFDLVFEKYKGKSVSISGSPYFIMGLGKFLRKPYLEASEITHDAYSDYEKVEFNFGARYCNMAKETPVVLDEYFTEPEWTGHKHKRRFKRKFGRLNLVLENKYIRKWKGHWNREMLRNLDRDGYRTNNLVVGDRNYAQNN